MERQLVVGDKVYLGRECFTTEQGEALEIPEGTTLCFPEGFAIRQYDPNSGMSGYGHPPKAFWNVTVLKQNNRVGIMLPEGVEIIDLGDSSFEIEREPIFVLVSLLRYVSFAKITALPTALPS